MSEGTKTGEKIQMDPRYILKLTLTLLITCVIVAGVLGYVNSITSGPIAKANEAKTDAALKAVVADPDNSKFDKLKITPEMEKAAGEYSATLDSVYSVKNGSESAGYAVKIVAGGSQGKIEMMVGIDGDGAVSGVSIVNNSETSGIGSKVMGNQALASGTKVLDQFEGKTAGDQPLKVGKNVDAITGATVSTKGVTKGVNGALAAVGAIG